MLWVRVSGSAFAHLAQQPFLLTLCGRVTDAHPAHVRARPCRRCQTEAADRALDAPARVA